MWAKPNRAEIKRMTRRVTYKSLAETIITGHFFMGSCDWYVKEFDGKDEFFGYVNLGDDMCSEWGYFYLSELQNLKVGIAEVDFDKHWAAKPASEIDKIIIIK